MMNYQIFLFLIVIGGMCLVAGLYGALVFSQSTVNPAAVGANNGVLILIGGLMILYAWYGRRKV
jgi:hypothetical protein